MKIGLSRDHGEYAVWVGLDDEEPPHGFTFIVGIGPTEFHARAEAVQALESAIAQLKSDVFDVHDFSES